MQVHIPLADASKNYQLLKNLFKCVCINGLTVLFRTILKDTGYRHDGRADNDSYPHDGRADKDSYPHDGRAD